MRAPSSLSLWERLALGGLLATARTEAGAGRPFRGRVVFSLSCSEGVWVLVSGSPRSAAPQEPGPARRPLRPGSPPAIRS